MVCGIQNQVLSHDGQTNEAEVTTTTDARRSTDSDAGKTRASVSMIPQASNQEDLTSIDMRDMKALRRGVYKALEAHSTHQAGWAITTTTRELNVGLEEFATYTAVSAILNS